MRRVIPALSILSVSIFAGCSTHAVLIPSSDSSLNKSATSFSTEAMACFPYPAELQRGSDIDARAELGYMWNVINLVNYSSTDWTNVELWVNRQYVLPLQTLESGKTKRISFKMLYNDQGEHMPLGGTMVESLELKRNGVLYSVPTQVGG